jgi:hypothetical protein
MGELDLQPSFRRRRALPENLQDKPGPVDHLGLGRGLQILLLDRRDRGVDDQKLGLGLDDGLGDRLGLALAEQGRRPGAADPEMELLGDVDPDRLGKPRRLLEPRLDVAKRIAGAEIGKGDDGAGAAGEFVTGIAVEAAQAPCSSSLVSRLSGLSG